jgi:hypothetical protein
MDPAGRARTRRGWASARLRADEVGQGAKATARWASTRVGGGAGQRAQGAAAGQRA